MSALSSHIACSEFLVDCSSWLPLQRIREAAEKARQEREAEEPRASANRDAENREVEKREAEKQAEARRAQESTAIAEREKAAIAKVLFSRAQLQINSNLLLW